MKMGRTKDVNHHGHQGHQGFTKASEDPLRATMVSFASFVVHVVGPPTRASLRSKLIFIPETRRSRGAEAQGLIFIPVVRPKSALADFAHQAPNKKPL